MCGIAAIFAYSDNGARVDREELLRIREAMIKRGPDGAGIWVSNNGRIGLAHRRLAIIDPTNDGLQPMTTPDETVRITFNGEIYNYRALRQSLEAKGYRFRSNSDTEVLLHLYREYGRDMLLHLSGMYAFALWDQTREALFLARDPLGIKPLYYADDGSMLRVASQVKAILAGGKVGGGPEAAGHVGFLLWGFVPEPYTLHRDIRALPAGRSMWVERGKQPRQHTVFNVTELFESAEIHAQASAPGINVSAQHEVLKSSLQESVRRHLVSDVPVGVFLSSGIDSLALASHVTELGGDLRTITLGFQEFRGTPNDETPLAERMAKELGATHRTVFIGKDDFQQDLPRILAAMDQPSIDGINSYFVAKAATEAGLKVAISGVGGDELFAGYGLFQKVDRIASTVAWTRQVPGFAKGFRVMSAPLFKQWTSPKYAGLFEYGGSAAGAYFLCRGLFMPWELTEFMDADMAREGWKTLQPLIGIGQSAGRLHNSRLRTTALEMCWYLRCQLLRDADWASMVNSLEVRTPLVDWHLLQELAPLLAGPRPPGKTDLAETTETPLPTGVRDRQKTGFIVPVKAWMRSMSRSRGYGSRGWARKIYRHAANNKRALVFVTDAFGGYGGIAKFNRSFLTALSSHTQFDRTLALPRIISAPIVGKLPPKLQFISKAAESKVSYAMAVLKLLVDRDRFDAVVCGHINLLPLAWLASRRTSAPLLLICHGIESWKPTARWIVNWCAVHVKYLLAVSTLTLERFQQWAMVSTSLSFILPNSVDMRTFCPRPKNQRLIDRYDLRDKTVLMTLARLSPLERYKGIDEVLEVMPNLLRTMPHLVYVIAGGGEDFTRLQEKVQALGILNNIRFTGMVQEEEKADLYNLADVFVMPGHGEGFGIVFLEAMACGIPVVGSELDGSREALRGGTLGIVVNPLDPSSIEQGIREAFMRGKGVPEGLDHFAEPQFEHRVRTVVDDVITDQLMTETRA